MTDHSAVTSGEEADSPWQCLEPLHNQWWCRSPADTPCPGGPCGPLWPGRSQPPQCTQRMCYSPWSGRGSCLCRRSGLSHLASSLGPGWAWRTRRNHRSDNRSPARSEVFTQTVALTYDVYLIFWHKLVLGFLQNLHSPHCGTYKGMTVSPKTQTACYVGAFTPYAALLSVKRREEKKRDNLVETWWLPLRRSPRCRRPRGPALQGKRPQGRSHLACRSQCDRSLWPQPEIKDCDHAPIWSWISAIMWGNHIHESNVMSNYFITDLQ